MGYRSPRNLSQEPGRRHTRQMLRKEQNGEDTLGVLHLHRRPNRRHQQTSSSSKMITSSYYHYNKMRHHVRDCPDKHLDNPNLWSETGEGDRPLRSEGGRGTAQIGDGAASRRLRTSGRGALQHTLTIPGGGGGEETDDSCRRGDNSGRRREKETDDSDRRQGKETA